MKNRYQKPQGGFIALTLIITVSSLLLAFSYTRSIDIAHFFDMSKTKEYRLMNHYNAGSCIDQAILVLTRDYFYETVEEIHIQEFHCSIRGISLDGDYRNIEAVGNYMGIDVSRGARVRMYDDHLEVVFIN